MKSERWKGRIGRIVGSRRRVGRDVDEEVAFHLEGRVEELVERGWSEADARAEAVRRFGDVEAVRRACVGADRDRMRREARGEHMHAVWQDVRQTLRALGRAPAFTAVTLLTLGLGIGATTAVFTVVDGVLLEPLPYPDADRLVVVWESAPERGVAREPVSPPNFRDWEAGSRSFRGLAAWTVDSGRLTEVDPPRILDVVYATDDFLRVLGVTPALGRDFLPGEGSGGVPGPVLISHDLWLGIFGGDPAAPGRTLVLEGVVREVAGVLPPGFDVPMDGIDVWVAHGFDDPATSRLMRHLTVLGRLAPEVGPDAARRDLDAVQARIAEDFPDANAGYGVDVVPAREELVGETRPTLLVLLGAVAVVLLVACVNVATLLVARAVHRGPEMALRRALGAGDGRIRRRLLTESLVLGGLGGAAGVLLAWAGVAALVALAPVQLPRLDEVGLDGGVLAFAAGVSLLAGVAFGLLPAFGPAGDLLSGLRAGSRADGRSARVRKALVVAELALSLVLLTGAGLLLRTVEAMRSVDPGFDAGGVYTARVSLPRSDYPPGPPTVAYHRELLERLRAAPEISHAGVALALPMDPAGIDFDLGYRVEGQPLLPRNELPQADYRIVSPGYMDAMGTEIVRGRDLLPSDREDARRVALVTETFARETWPGQDPLGRWIEVHYATPGGLRWEVVGVVEDTRTRGLAVPPRRQFFVSYAQAEFLFDYMQVVARESRPGAAVPAAMRAAALQVDDDLPLYELGTMEAHVAADTARERFAAAILTAFAALALILAAGGTYGVVAYQVARRTREIGVRVALGARPSRVVRGVVGEALTLGLVGVAAGIPAAALAANALEALLWGVDPLDPATFAGVAGVLVATTVAAALVPARRALALDPAASLRTE